MQASLALVLAFALAGSGGATWQPPAQPDPHVILEEARVDARAGRQATALAKFVWFHDNALAIEPSLRGVRLSFALSYWHELALAYTPALEEMKARRDSAARAMTQGGECRNAFAELAGFNRVLGDEPQTQAAFEALDASDPRCAASVFALAYPALVRGEAYALASKYIDPDRELSRLIETFRQGKRFVEEHDGDPELLHLEARAFSNGASTLVAILALNGRDTEAKETAARARVELDDAAFHAKLDRALAGVVPEPWP